MALTKVCKSTVQSQLSSFYHMYCTFVHLIGLSVFFFSDFDPTNLLCVQLHIYTTD